MARVLFFLLLFVWIISNEAMAGDVITATEVENCFYADGKMKCSKGEFRNTYYRDGDKIVRTNVYNIKKKESLVDDTEYSVIGNLSSDPRNNNKGTIFPQVIRAIGFPGADAVEILAIEKEYIQAVKSTSNYFSISRFKIEK